VSRDRLEVVVQRDSDLPVARAVVARVTTGEPEVDEGARRVSGPVAGGVAALTGAVRSLADEGIELADIGLRRPTLDDVFLRLTGHRADPGEVAA